VTVIGDAVRVANVERRGRWGQSTLDGIGGVSAAASAIGDPSASDAEVRVSA
jgi:hypothetical protein